ncbi:MAG: Na+/H+ antiporter subunit E [Clostridia bacterium]|nr:Na+/H+ antiporter subunit E [Clostridia bacterium]
MFLILFGLWVVFNGKWTTEIALLGVAVSGLIYAFTCAFIGLSPRKELHYLRNAGRGIAYLWLLLREIVKANWQVLRLIWSPRLEVEPELHTFHTKVKSDFGKAIQANSITLTPGTITVHVRDDLFMVHCLDRELAEGLEDSEFEKRLEKMEAKKS